MIRYLALVVLTACLALGHAQAEERRLALIIANEDYPASIGRLTNTHEDAATVEAALRTAGFAVTKVLDADADAMESALTQFEIAIDAEAADGDDVVAFFYGSMHGAAADVDGRTQNFLLPAKEEIASTGQLIRKGVRMDQMISGLASTNAKAVLVVSDACRNNMATSFSKSTTKGFVAERTRPGMLVAYATSPGATTPDDGLFARVLAEELVKPGRKASFAMLAAIENVAKERSFDGQPFLSSGGLPDWLCLGGCEILPPPGRNADEQDWGRFARLDTMFGYQAYLSLHPNGRYVETANARISELEAGAESKAEPAPPPMFLSAGPQYEPGDTFRDPLIGGEQGPEMVVVPAGEFLMGSPADEVGRKNDESPQKRVTIGSAFAVAQHEISASEFDVFVRDSRYEVAPGCIAYVNGSWSSYDERSWRNPGFGFTTEAHPAVCITWDDAKAYAVWLSRKTGETYRLLTEAEWEYAARAGTAGPYVFGNSISTSQANYDRDSGTTRVGQYSANPFGLYDMHGNAKEWVEDCYSSDYSSQSADGAAKTVRECPSHVVRGGSWCSEPERLRSADRSRYSSATGNRFNDIGFRVARDL